MTAAAACLDTLVLASSANNAQQERTPPNTTPQFVWTAILVRQTSIVSDAKVPHPVLARPALVALQDLSGQTARWMTLASVFPAIPGETAQWKSRYFVAAFKGANAILTHSHP